MDRCEQCKRVMTDDKFDFRHPAYGCDWGASHFFCDECLTLLEIGQGLSDDPLFAAEWRAMIKEHRAEDPGYILASQRDGRKALRLYRGIQDAA